MNYIIHIDDTNDREGGLNMIDDTHSSISHSSCGILYVKVKPPTSKVAKISTLQGEKLPQSMIVACKTKLFY